MAMARKTSNSLASRASDSTLDVSGSRTSFVGRTRELSELARFVNDAVPVTIVGTVGAGKSRLAEEVVKRLERRSISVSLTDTRDPEGCLAKIADALTLQGGESIEAALSRRGDLFLLLDDADHVTGALAMLIPRWLNVAPALGVLVTSRERLRFGAEQVFELAPLSLDGGASSPAAQLFAARVAQAAPQTQLDDDALVRWSTWLEGLPLAIELAAMRAPLLGRIDGKRRIDLLTDGFRDARPKHATLRCAIEWSFQLLDESEQRALAEVSAFAGAFPADLGSRVLSGADSLGVLRVLAEKSLASVTRDGRIELPGGLREFAAEVAPDAREEALRRLEEQLARLAQEDAVPESLSAEFVSAAERVVARTTSLDADASAWILLGAARCQKSRGPAEQLHTWMRHGLSQIAPHDDLTARLRVALSSALRREGALDDAADVVSEALELDLDGEIRALALTELAIVRQTQRDLDAASELYEFALQLSSSRLAIGRLHANLGTVAHDRVELDVAETRYRQALSVLGATTERRILGVVRSHLAILFQERGDLIAAQENFERALEDLDAGDERYLGAIHRSNLGHLLLEMDDTSGASACHDASLDILRSARDPKSVLLCLCRRAAAHGLGGDLKQAQRDLEEASGQAHDLQDPLLSQIVALYTSFVPLGRAILASDEARDQRIAECRSMMASAKSSGPGWRVSDDARAAQRILETQLGRLTQSQSGPPVESLVIGIESRFFRVPGGEWQDLRRHTAARRILEHLIEHGPVSASMADLQAAAWPDERIKKSAATNRVHVALSQLRQRGLKGLLTRDADGYRLDPKLPVHRLALTAPPA